MVNGYATPSPILFAACLVIKPEASPDIGEEVVRVIVILGDPPDPVLGRARTIVPVPSSVAKSINAPPFVAEIVTAFADITDNT